jgi:aminopeptidase N
MNSRLVDDAEGGDALTAARTRASGGLPPIGVGTSSRYGVLPSSDDGGGGSGPTRRRAPRTFLPTRPVGHTAGSMSTRNKIYAATATGLLALVAAVTLGVTLSKRDVAGGDDGCAYAGYRLASVAAPSSYALSLRPDFGPPYGFSGNVTVDVVLTGEDGQACLQLHADGLTVTAATVTDVTTAGGPPRSASVARYDAANQRVVLALPQVYDAGARLLVSLSFTGTLGTDMTGLYRSSYENAGTSVDIVATQFEATAARRAFPCWDEPEYKAVVNVTVDGVPVGYTALSNMPPVSSGPSPSLPGGSTVVFAPSPRMSTYLVALVVAPLVGVTGTTATGVNVTAWAVNRANNTDRLRFALGVALDVLPYYGSLFGGLQYPLPKMDMVAVPDFAAGAMEK